MSNTKKETKPKVNKKFFIKEDGDIKTVYKEYFEAIASRDEALNLAVQVFLEINATLVEDSDEEDSYIGNMKVLTGLTRSLSELNSRFPAILEQIHSLDLKLNGKTLFKC